MTINSLARKIRVGDVEVLQRLTGPAAKDSFDAYRIEHRKVQFEILETRTILL